MLVDAADLGQNPLVLQRRRPGHVHLPIVVSRAGAE